MPLPRLNSVQRTNLAFLQALPTVSIKSSPLDLDKDGNLRIRSGFFRAMGWVIPFYDRYLTGQVEEEINRLMGRLDAAAFSHDSNRMKQFFLEKAALLPSSAWDRRMNRDTYAELERLVPVHTLEKCDKTFQKLYAESQFWFQMGSHRRPLKGGASGSYEIIKGALTGSRDQVVEDATSLAIYKPSDQSACGANNPSRLRRIWSVILRIFARLPILRLLGGSIETSCNGPEGRVAEEVSSRIGIHIEDAVRQFMNSPEGAELPAQAKNYLSHLLEIGFVPPTKAVLHMGHMGPGSLQKWITESHSSLDEASDSPAKVVPFSLLQLIAIRDVVQGQCDSTKSNLLIHWGLDQQRKQISIGVTPIDGWFAMPRLFPNRTNYLALRHTYPWARWESSRRPFGPLGKAVITYLSSLNLREEILELYNRQLPDSGKVNEERVERMMERLELLCYFSERGFDLSKFRKATTGQQIYYHLGHRFSVTQLHPQTAAASA